ncbi:hypothetical protein RBG61_01880 [Paludicola sp. MB14-C6]|uniref:hypothetical protein n=1 Tax=Paludihabitans sp. MB14-C6 TaxID=3070656 RepID=UPI0027DE7C0F|nr:hypothetical protein [Paludicola sp. MB14-C6]WMJ23440.1 hypothetical protein RBG61_01880 [Paludicola sp. MB14-C6]
MEDLQVYFTPINQAIIDQAIGVKVRCVKVYTVQMAVEPVPFNKGFYSVDMKFYFLVKLDCMRAGQTCPDAVEGISVFCKKVILYGSEGSVNTFTSDVVTTNGSTCGFSCCDENAPRASVSVVNPICLACNLCDAPNCLKQVTFNCPKEVEDLFDDEFNTYNPIKVVYISIGLFSIVQLQRSIQMMVPAYDFCIPNKECVATNDDPCEIFKKIKFPVNEFFPPKLGECSCGED